MMLLPPPVVPRRSRRTWFRQCALPLLAAALLCRWLRRGWGRGERTIATSRGRNAAAPRAAAAA